MPKGHFPFHAGDYLNDEVVLAMTFEQRGVYVQLLCLNWLEGSIPADPDKLSRILKIPREHFDEIWPEIALGFPLEDGGRLCNKRMNHELTMYQGRVKAGRHYAEKRWRKNGDGVPSGSPNGEPNANQHPNTPTRQLTTAYSAAFEKAWATYPPRRNNPKKRAYKAWQARLREGASEGELLAGVKRYAAFVRATRPEEQFIKQAATFLGPDEHWRETYEKEVPQERVRPVKTYHCTACDVDFESRTEPGICPTCTRAEMRPA